MKYIIYITLIASIFLIESCSIEKRVHQSGYSILWQTRTNGNFSEHVKKADHQNLASSFEAESIREIKFDSMSVSVLTTDTIISLSDLSDTTKKIKNNSRRGPKNIESRKNQNEEDRAEVETTKEKKVRVEKTPEEKKRNNRIIWIVVGALIFSRIVGYIVYFAFL